MRKEKERTRRFNDAEISFIYPVLLVCSSTTLIVKSRSETGIPVSLFSNSERKEVELWGKIVLRFFFFFNYQRKFIDNVTRESV